MATDYPISYHVDQLRFAAEADERENFDKILRLIERELWRDGKSKLAQFIGYNAKRLWKNRANAGQVQSAYESMIGALHKSKVNPERATFSTGGFVLHKIDIDGKKYSAWYDENGALLSAENIDKRGRARAVRQGAKVWTELQRWGRIYKNPSPEFAQAVEDEKERLERERQKLESVSNPRGDGMSCAVCGHSLKDHDIFDSMACEERGCKCAGFILDDNADELTDILSRLENPRKGAYFGKYWEVTVSYTKPHARGRGQSTIKVPASTASGAKRSAIASLKRWLGGYTDFRAESAREIPNPLTQNPAAPLNGWNVTVSYKNKRTRRRATANILVNTKTKAGAQSKALAQAKKMFAHIGYTDFKVVSVSEYIGAQNGMDITENPRGYHFKEIIALPKSAQFDGYKYQARVGNVNNYFKTRKSAENWIDKQYGKMQSSAPANWQAEQDFWRTASNPRGVADSDAARELYLYVDNDADLHKRMIEGIRKNLVTKMARGTYDAQRAVKAFMYPMDAGAQKYAREFGGTWHEMFSKPTRQLAAAEMAREFEYAAKDGDFDYLLPKKYQQKNPRTVKNALVREYKRRGFAYIQIRKGVSGSGEPMYTVQYALSTRPNYGYVESFKTLAEAQNWVKHALQSKKRANPELFNIDKLDQLSAMFQGEITGGSIETVGSDLTPPVLSRIGQLSMMKIRNGKDVYEVTFSGDAWLSMDARKNLHVNGKQARIKNVHKPKKGQLQLVGELEQINYITAKRHIENGNTVEYWHPLGEVDSVKPQVFIDSDGFPLILNGNYDIGVNGIEN